MRRTCIGCGVVFSTKNVQQRKCSPNCNKAESYRFVGVDGEGITLPDGSHHYVLLSIDDRSLTVSDGKEHLEWWEIFDFIRDYVLEFPNDILVGFFLEYDFTHWLRTFPEARARILLTKEGRAVRARKVAKHLPPFPVEIRDPMGRKWEIDTLPRRRVKLRLAGDKQWAWICDTGPFWQCSFLKAIDPSTWPSPICTPEDYAIIEEGKARRANAVLDRDMIRYNVTENRVLGQLTHTLDKAFRDVGIVLKRQQWFGPGQVASKWLATQDIPKWDETRTLLGDDVLRAVWGTFYGGWFEIFAHGHVGNAEEDDVNSAYPYVIKGLPCLRHGKWRHGTGPMPDGKYVLGKSYVEGSDPYIGAMLHRTATGRILRPHRTMGWYWKAEVDAARRAGLIDTVSTEEWYAYEPCTCVSPLAGIGDLYLERLRIGKNSPEGIALKLIYNSVYGKFAQTIGKPEWANPMYASLITSGCRTMILNAIGTHPGKSSAVVMVATDGVYFREPHPGLDRSDTRLGAWDSKMKENLTLFQPGVYWDDKTRARIASGLTPMMKSRGVNAKHLAEHITRLDDEYTRFTGAMGTWPELEISIPFSMVTALQALAWRKWETAGTIHTEDHNAKCDVNCKRGHRVVRSTPIEKRNPVVRREDGMWRSSPYSVGKWWTGEFEESHPYSKMISDADDLITLDGSDWSDLMEVLH